MNKTALDVVSIDFYYSRILCRFYSTMSDSDESSEVNRDSGDEDDGHEDGGSSPESDDVEQAFCAFCDKSFKSSWYLQRHMMQHLQIKAYHCWSCEQNNHYTCFAQGGQLKLHLAKQHKLGEKGVQKCMILAKEKAKSKIPAIIYIIQYTYSTVYVRANTPDKITDITNEAKLTLPQPRTSLEQPTLKVPFSQARKFSHRTTKRKAVAKPSGRMAKETAPYDSGAESDAYRPHIDFQPPQACEQIGESIETRPKSRQLTLDEAKMRMQEQQQGQVAHGSNKQQSYLQPERRLQRYPDALQVGKHGTGELQKVA